MTVVLSGIRLIFYLLNVSLFCVQGHLFDYFGSMDFPRARGPRSYVEALFFYDF